MRMAVLMRWASTAPGPPPLTSEAALRVAAPLREEPVADRPNWTIPRLRRDRGACRRAYQPFAVVQGAAKKTSLAAAPAQAARHRLKLRQNGREVERIGLAPAIA